MFIFSAVHNETERNHIFAVFFLFFRITEKVAQLENDEQKCLEDWKLLFNTTYEELESLKVNIRQLPDNINRITIAAFIANLTVKFQSLILKQ